MRIYSYMRVEEHLNDLIWKRLTTFLLSIGLLILYCFCWFYFGNNYNISDYISDYITKFYNNDIYFHLQNIVFIFVLNFTTYLQFIRTRNEVRMTLKSRNDEKEEYSDKNEIGGNDKMGSWLNFKNNKEEEESAYIDENETYSFGDDSEEPIHSEKQEKYINVDKSKEEDFNKFIEIKSFISEQLKGDVGRSRIDSAILILEKKFKSNLDLIYKGTTNYKIKQDCISDNDNILSNLREMIFEYNLKEQELLKEKEQELIEDSLLQIKKCLDISILSKSSC